uniref:ABC transporter ATP-binding protein n=1 Tax=Rodentolepis nana TaxID=102285 RepID=A0A0R3TVC2_RODNA
LEELRIRNVRTLDEVSYKFNAYGTIFMNSSIGVQWGEVARQQIRALNNERLAKEKTNAYLRNLSELQHYAI